MYQIFNIVPDWDKCSKKQYIHWNHYINNKCRKKIPSVSSWYNWFHLIQWNFTSIIQTLKKLLITSVKPLKPFILIFYSIFSPYRWGLEYTDCIPCRRVRPLKWNVLHMTLMFIWCWGSSSGDLGNGEYLFIAINIRFLLTCTDSTCYAPVYESNKSVWKLFVFSRTVCKKKTKKL